MTIKIDTDKLYENQDILKARLGMLKTFKYLANKNEIKEIEKLIEETESILQKTNTYNTIVSKEKISDEDFDNLSEISNDII